jgi:hypothetical protein
MPSYIKHHCCCNINPFKASSPGTSCWGCEPPDPCPCPPGAPFCWDDLPGGGCPSANCAGDAICTDNPNEECCAIVCNTQYCCCDRLDGGCSTTSAWETISGTHCVMTCPDDMCPNGFEQRYWPQLCPALDGSDGGGCLYATCSPTTCGFNPGLIDGDYAHVVIDGKCVWMDCGMGGCPYPPCME